VTQPTLSRRRFLQGAGALVAAAAAGTATGATHDAAAATTGVARVASPSLRGLQDAVRGAVFVPGNAGYAEAAQVYNERFDSIRPLAVARPVNATQVRDAVRWAVTHGVALRARSGGHSYAGYSTLDDGVVLDLRNLRQVDLERSAGTATVGAGTQLIDLYVALASGGATVPAGSCPSVGISGVSLGGGMGLAGRAYGLTTDHIVEAELVTADGRLRTVNTRTDPDLLWALRGGGGGNFGIVTEFTLKLRPMPSSATYFFLSWPWETAPEALHAWMRWAPRTDSSITSIFRLEIADGEPQVGVSGQLIGPQANLRAVIGPVLDLPGAVIQSGSEAYLPLQLRWAGCADTSQAACHTVGAAPDGTLPRSYFYAKSDYVKEPISEQGAAALVAAVAARGNTPGSGAVLFDSYGGAINQVAPDATAFVHRDQLCAIQYLSYGGDYSWVQQAWRTMRPYVSGQAYQNYIDADLRGWQRAYYAGNYERLLATREEYDPDHFFNFRQAIGR
jgi:FAD/FMN-containing dehydrogenase